MGNLTVYAKMKTSADMLVDVIKKEVGVKACAPFAIRAFDALSSLDIKTEAEGRKAANTFLDGLQTLIHGGATTEDYDKIDLVKRGKEITLSLRVEGLIRAVARKGYRIIDTIIPVPLGSNVYFEEAINGGEIIYLLRDDRKITDRKITPSRLIENYFEKFICRLEVRHVTTNQRVAMTAIEMSNDDVIQSHNASDNGIYKTRWEECIDDGGYKKKRKVKTDKINVDSIWYKWTSEMVNKTVLRRALKKVREALPELEKTFYAFDEQPTEIKEQHEKEIILPQIKCNDVDLKNLDENQLRECVELLEMYKANPQMAKQDAERVSRDFYENGKKAQSIANDDYAILFVLSDTRAAARSTILPILEELGVA
jgi:hypothetical protein